MAKYEIYTEDKNLNRIEDLCNERFNGFSIQKQIGYYKGTKEKSLCIVIFTQDGLLVNFLAQKIKLLNCQETVLIWDGKQEFYV